jgi:hypothetical protein
LEPELFEFMFKKIHGIDDGAELVQVSVDEQTGQVACFLFIDDEVASSLTEGFMELGETDEIMECFN